MPRRAFIVCLILIGSVDGFQVWFWANQPTTVYAPTPLNLVWFGGANFLLAVLNLWAIYEIWQRRRATKTGS